MADHLERDLKDRITRSEGGKAAIDLIDAGM